MNPLIVSPPIIAIPFSPSGCKITAWTSYKNVICPILLYPKKNLNMEKETSKHIKPVYWKDEKAARTSQDKEISWPSSSLGPGGHIDV